MNDNYIFSGIIYKKNVHTGELRISKAFIISVLLAFIIFVIYIFSNYIYYEFLIMEDFITGFFLACLCWVYIFSIGWLIGYLMDYNTRKSMIAGQMVDRNIKPKQERKRRSETRNRQSTRSAKRETRNRQSTRSAKRETQNSQSTTTVKKEKPATSSVRPRTSSNGIMPLKEKGLSLPPSPVCDVCNARLNVDKAWFVPNKIFYGSRKYRDWNRRHYPLPETESEFNVRMSMMESMDPSEGSAICENCIHMFR